MSLPAWADGVWTDEYRGEPWVRNASRPFDVKYGLDGRHISVWASHGRYYRQGTHKWEWQRPALFGTREDLFTQTIVSTYLIPMLENAGAVVFMPRERDMQTQEVIVDNDQPAQVVSYRETTARQAWRTAPCTGFAPRRGPYTDGENPFSFGTARMADAVKSRQRQSTVTYQPNMPVEGRYAVYVSYPRMDNAVADAHYTVYHRGQATEIRVNQRMGAGTWVYIGTYDFGSGSSQANRVVVSNYSRHDGTVGTDAVRFGGGMGNIARGDTADTMLQLTASHSVSGLPRYLEGARYWAQWAGMPYDIYSPKMGADDYSDDINSRSLMTNYLGGGSPYMPGLAGLGVPIEMALAVHSDAGYERDGQSVYGPLAICTTKDGAGKKPEYAVAESYPGGPNRYMSYALAERLLADVEREMQRFAPDWVARGVKDRNYSETRLPAVPSVILETMSHQSFPDMFYGQDPNFRFFLARTIYKSMLRQIALMHSQKRVVVQPLAPHNFAVTMGKGRDELQLSWAATNDPLDPTAVPTGYVLYTAIDDGGFDNGVLLTDHTSHRLQVEPEHLYRFRLTAVNDGGESFPTTTLVACRRSRAAGTVMIIDGFNRLASPAVVNDSLAQGFDLDADMGVTLGPTMGWAGRQTCFDRTAMGRTDSEGLGATDQSLVGQLIAGNNRNHVAEHAEGIMALTLYNIVSADADAVATGLISLRDISAVDLVLGLQQDDGHSVVQYQAISPGLQQQLRQYAHLHGSLLVSGAYLGSDMQNDDDRRFMNDILHCRHTAVNRSASESVQGLGLTTPIYRQPNAHHYFATRCDVLEPTTKGAFPIMSYPNGNSAAVAYSSNGQGMVAVGFPLECIKNKKQRRNIISTLVKYILQ